MATTEELQEQINALLQQCRILSSHFDEQIVSDAKNFIENQTEFVKSIATISAIIAPFSLILLQADTKIINVINIKYLFAGFAILMVNVFCIFAFLRFLLWIDYRRKARFLNAGGLQNIQELFGDNIKKTTDKQCEDIGRLLCVITDLQNLLGNDFAQGEEKKKVNLSLFVRETMIWVSLLLLFIGIALIIVSFSSVF
jgi:hypothetical protein